MSALTAGFKKLAGWGVVALAAYYAVFGGEYSVFELRSARAGVLEQQDDLEAVGVEIDSLRAWADSLENDPGTIERIAREEFGMIRDGETLYRFVDTEPAGDRAELPER